MRFSRTLGLRAFWEGKKSRADSPPDADAVPRALMNAFAQDQAARKVMSDATAAMEALPLREAPTFNELRAAEF
jgi:hypothetical protein